MTAWPRRHGRPLRGGVLLSFALVLTGCSAVATGTPMPDSDHLGAAGSMSAAIPALPVVEVAAAMPFTWAESELRDTGWDQRPRQQGAFFVGYASAGGELEYSVVDAHGDVRWRVTRPATCTGYAVSIAGGDPVVVLTDAVVDPAEGAWTTTATAYDLATGTPRWGPVSVPGTVQGPGLVFGASAPAATLGDSGPRIALDPSTGRVVAAEHDLAEDGETIAADAVIGEYDGVVLVRDGDDLIGVDTAAGTERFRVALPAGAAVTASIEPAPEGVALLDRAVSGAVRTQMIGLATGVVIAADVDQAGYEPLSKTWIYTSGAEVHGIPAHDEPWSRDLPARPELHLVGAGLVYLQYGDVVHALNAVTGRDAQAWPAAADSGYAVPLAMSDDAAALFAVDGDIVLATVP